MQNMSILTDFPALEEQKISIFREDFKRGHLQKSFQKKSELKIVFSMVELVRALYASVLKRSWWRATHRQKFPPLSRFFHAIPRVIFYARENAR